MINGLAAAVFLGMALAWVFAVLNGALSALNLIVHFGRENTRRE